MPRIGVKLGQQGKTRRFRASDGAALGAGGRRFESSLPDHNVRTPQGHQPAVFFRFRGNVLHKESIRTDGRKRPISSRNFEYISVSYHHQRLHLSLGYKAPAVF